MLISIVSGTFNRLHLLQTMISSVRSQMYSGMKYEIILVDGGSTDGTLEWIRQQPDIQLIEHGQLLGAIKAFCDGARAAQGEYVLLANDDIEFAENSIITALAHLEDNRNCGAVAFADNRLGKIHGQPTHYQVNYHSVVDDRGNCTTAPYAQVGLVRRELGAAVGWWGDNDSIMSQARTYGGDNYLSARVWESGYTVETCPGCKVHDIIERDDLRYINGQSGERDSQLFYTRFPNCSVKFGSDPLHINYPDERLRILYLPIYEGQHQTQRQQKRGLRRALQKVGIVLEYDYIGREMNGADVAGEVTELVRMFRPDVLFTQFHGVPSFGLSLIQQVRLERPTMYCVNWNGDYWPHIYLAEDTIQLLKYYDLALVVNLNVLPEYTQAGIPAAYWQIAGEEPETYPDMPRYDVLFLGNCYSEYRERLETILTALPYRVGLYGSRWKRQNGDTLYDYAASQSLCANATICIGDNQFPDGSGYVSNRFFETLHAGGFLLHQEVPNLYRATGYRAGQHYASFDTLEELPAKIDYWMRQTKRRETIRRRGQEFTHARHTFAARVKELFLELIPGHARAPV